jgi:hypothetical protein
LKTLKQNDFRVEALNLLEVLQFKLVYCFRPRP